MKTMTLAEALKAYAATLPPQGTSEAVQKRMPMASFCDVSVRTVERWVLAGQQPVGAALVKLRVFLWQNGYPVQEIVGLNPMSRKLVALVAFKAMSVDELKHLLDYSGPDEVLRLLHGKSQALPHRVDQIDKMWDEYSELLSPEQRQLVEADFSEYDVPRAQKPLTSSDYSEAQALGSRDGEEVSDPGEPGKLEISLESVAYLILCLLPMVEAVASDRFSPEDRRALREMTGSSGVFQLSNAMNKLCGEEARKRSLSHGNSIPHKP